jgi:hypothetical protein
LFWLINVLDALDAALTTVAVKTGLAVEGNPIVEWIGLPGKWRWSRSRVPVCRLRPVALMLPIVVLAATVIWSVIGLLLYS